MKKILTAMVMLAAVAVAPVFATGYTTMRGNIPFEFVVGGKTLPSGEYDVADSFTQDTLYIKRVDGKASALAITQPTAYAYALNASDETKFTFEMINGKHYLVGATRPGMSKQVNRPAGGGSEILAYVKAVLR